MANSSFHLVSYKNCTIKFYILFRYTSVAPNSIKVVLFEAGLSDI